MTSTKKKRRAQSSTVPSRVWVQFNESWFPNGVTMLRDEAMDWKRDGDLVREYALVPPKVTKTKGRHADEHD